MKVLELSKSNLNGIVNVPPSKSVSHRAIICAALGSGISIIENIDYSDDINATIDAMVELGALIDKKENSVIINGVYRENSEKKLVRSVDCNESGSTLRFIIPISLLFDGMTKFVGKGNLGKRPLNTYFDIFKDQGIKYSNVENELNMIVKGILKPAEFVLPGNISSQFITGLLFTLPLLNGDSKIIISTEIESKGYIDLTLSCMKNFGIEVENHDYREFLIKGNQKYLSRKYKVEGDYSQAAFYFAANALGANVAVSDLKINSLQGDKEVIDILERMGATFYIDDNNIKCRAYDELVGTTIDASQCPDIIPVISLVAALSKGRTEITNAGRLRIKECDRLSAITTELNKLGAKIQEKEDGLIIDGVEELNGDIEVWSWKDHRIAMTLAIASTRCKKPIKLLDYDCIAKSYPNFFEDFKILGGNVNEWDMGK